MKRVSISLQVWAFGTCCASQAALVVKNLLASAGDIEMRAWSLGQEDHMGEGMATHSSIFAWRIPRTEETGGFMGSQRVGLDWSGLACTHIPWLILFCHLVVILNIEFHWISRNTPENSQAILRSYHLIGNDARITVRITFLYFASNGSWVPKHTTCYLPIWKQHTLECEHLWQQSEWIFLYQKFRIRKETPSL